MIADDVRTRLHRRWHSDTSGDVRLKGAFVIGQSSRARWLHLPQRAVAVWPGSRAARLRVATMCGKILWRATSLTDAPADLTLCDNCVLADYYLPTVYRLIGHAGEVLYVGCSQNLILRLASHRSQPYWPRVADVTWEEYQTLGIALDAEEALIRALRPPLNIEYTNRGKRYGRRRTRVSA